MRYALTAVALTSFITTLSAAPAPNAPTTSYFTFTNAQTTTSYLVQQQQSSNTPTPGAPITGPTPVPIVPPVQPAPAPPAPLPVSPPVQPAPPAPPVVQPPPAVPAPAPPAVPVPSPQPMQPTTPGSAPLTPGNADKYTLHCEGGAYDGKRLDAVNGTIVVHTSKVDKKNAAVMEFQTQQATGPFAGQIYYIDSEGALKYTNPGEQPAGTTSGLSNDISSGADQGELKYEEYQWASCPMTGSEYGDEAQQVFAEVEGYNHGKNSKCTCFKVCTEKEKY